MDAEQIAHWRLRSQRLIGTPYASPERVLQAFGAMQAQEFTVAKWSIGMRTARADITTDRDRNPTAPALDRAVLTALRAATERFARFLRRPLA